MPFFLVLPLVNLSQFLFQFPRFHRLAHYCHLRRRPREWGQFRKSRNLTGGVVQYPRSEEIRMSLHMCTICTFQFFGSVISFVCNLGFVKMQKMCRTICKEVKTQSTGPIISTTPPALLFSASIGSRMGEEGSPTARNNTDDGTAIVLHWLCFVHRSQKQGDKKGILAETFS